MAGVFTEGNNDAVAAVVERNIADKKPHKVVRSARDRYTVCCKDPECLYSVTIRKCLDGLKFGASTPRLQVRMERPLSDDM